MSTKKALCAGCEATGRANKFTQANWYEWFTFLKFHFDYADCGQHDVELAAELLRRDSR